MKRALSTETLGLWEENAKFLKQDSKNNEENLKENAILENFNYESLSPFSSTSATESTEVFLPKILSKYIDIKCGNLFGRLHTALFICPGIREACIDVPELPGVMLTPIEFTVKAEKNKQKDWKGAIKHNGKMLRTLMELKQLDFYNHHEQCSLKCHSRNYITKNGGLTKRPSLPPRAKQNLNRSDPATSNSQNHAFIMKEKLLNSPNFLAALAAQWNAEKRQEDVELKLQQKQQVIKNLMDNDANTFWVQTIESKQHGLVMNAVSREMGNLAQNICFGRDFESSSKKLSDILRVLEVSDSLSREMCGNFILPPPSSRPTSKPVNEEPIQVENGKSLRVYQHQEITPILPITNPVSTGLFSNKININYHLSSSEKLELMINNLC